MDERIIDFLQKQSIVTICCADEDGNPHCFPCFFALNSQRHLLYFKTSPTSFHSLLMAKRPEIAGSILPDRLNVLGLKGVQLEGIVLPTAHELNRNSNKYYYKKFPMGLLMPGEIYAVELTSVKMTDSTRGFKKITWEKAELV